MACSSGTDRKSNHVETKMCKNVSVMSWEDKVNFTLEAKSLGEVVYMQRRKLCFCAVNTTKHLKIAGTPAAGLSLVSCLSKP